MTYGWTEFGEYGPVHWLSFAFAVAAVLYPIGRILRRLGFSPFWSVLALVPFFNLLMLWILAFRDWPTLNDQRS